MKIAFLEMEDWAEEYIKNNLKGHDLLFFKGLLKDIDMKKLTDMEILSTFVFSKIDKKVLDKLPKLKMIATMSTGYDHIDLKECARRKILVCNVPYYGENTVAEHTFALILTLSRKIYPSMRKTKKGLFNQDDLRGFDLKGKTIGLIGTGHISYHVAKIAKGFEMDILGYDIFQNNEFKKIGLKYVPLNELLKKSDIVSLHLPLNEHTKHIINSKNIKLMKKNALIINTARGGLIDTTALGEALVEGKIAGAGLDVLENEQYIKHEDELLKAHFKKAYDIRTVLENQILTKLDNVAITPHNAFNSEEALKRIIDTTVENIKAFSKGKPIDIVKLQ